MINTEIKTLEELEELVRDEALETLGGPLEDFGINLVAEYRFKPGTNTHNGWLIVFNYVYKGDSTGKPTTVVNIFTGRDIVISLNKVTKYEKSLIKVDNAVCDILSAIKMKIDFIN